MKENMKAVRQHVAGGNLSVEEIKIPSPAHGEVLIKMDAAPINPSDLAFIEGIYGEPNKYPITPGFEGSGLVVGTGGGVLARMRMGKRVACNANPGEDGSWAEYMVTSATRCIPLSKKIDSEQGSMMIVNPMTALAFTEIAQRGGHKAVVSTAAASALGKMLIVLFISRKIPLINVVRSEKQVEALKRLGAEYVLNSSESTFSEELSMLCHKLEASLFFEAIGGKTGSKLIEVAPEKSRIILYAKLSGENIEMDPREILRNDKTIEGFQLGNYMGKMNLAGKLRMIRKARRLLEGQAPVTVQKIFPIAEVNKACETYKSSMSRGKVLLKP